MISWVRSALTETPLLRRSNGVFFGFSHGYGIVASAFKGKDDES